MRKEMFALNSKHTEFATVPSGGLTAQHLSLAYDACKLLIFVTIFGNLLNGAASQIAYKRHLSDLRINELRNIAKQMEQSINPDKYACESFYDYVCSKNRPLYTVLGRLPSPDDLIELLSELQHDPVQFDAKQKLMDFFVSCNTLKSVEDCYRETFEYFKPLFGYVITKHHIDGSVNEHIEFLNILREFLEESNVANYVENFERHPSRLHLEQLRDKFVKPNVYFRAGDLNDEYRNLRIYRESYEHNIKNLEQHRKRNSTFEMGIQRVMLDWSLYVFQSRNKPRSYYYPTFNVHLWMTLYNTTVRDRDRKRLHDHCDCLKLPQYVNVLDEACILAIVYLKSFRRSWEDYIKWISASHINREIFDQENEILRPFHLNNKRLFFTLYAQNFCEFGKELSENIFYVGLRQNQDFYSIYSCGFQTEQRFDCPPL